MFRSAYDSWKLQSPEDSGFYRFDEQDDDEEEEDMSKTRYEITLAYTDRKGEKRYVNNVGALFIGEDGRGSIILPPGMALTGGDGHYINVALPRERDAGGGGGRQQRGRDDDSEMPF